MNRPRRAREHIGSHVATGVADLEAYGQMVVANPDFVERLKANTPMNEADRSTYFGGDVHGYTDCSLMAEAQPG